HEAKGDAAGAEQLYRRELEIYPDNGRARFNLAQILRGRGDRAGYLAELRQGVAQAPEFGPCYWYLAREELDGGRLDEAADLARRGLEAQPVSDVAPLGHYVLADVYNRRRQPAKAQEEVSKARKLEAALRKKPPSGLSGVPGLTDAHVHVEGIGAALESLDLVGAATLEEALRRVADRVPRLAPGDWLLGRGWDQNDWPGQPFPGAADLDRVSGAHPVYL